MHKDSFERHVEKYFNDVDQTELGDLLEKPTAIGWKVAGSDFHSSLRAIMEFWGGVEQVHIGTVNDRKIASLVFSESFARGIQVVKLMQRRPGSSDEIGTVDHVDFFVTDIDAAHRRAEGSGLLVEAQANDAHSWLSATLEGEHFTREIKFVDRSVLAIGVRSLADAEQSIMGDE
ncbi:TPA: hypothetical protein EYO12_02115 [Candidatus Saccharibacteria bacterium]|nr:hypothetical protein [Candidatus Saccharibacteria bacterium]HIO87512.1 hypothetical protein [Candidatus Saccharibacteria bacterium]